MVKFFSSVLPKEDNLDSFFTVKLGAPPSALFFFRGRNGDFLYTLTGSGGAS